MHAHSLTFMQDSIGRFVSSERLLAEVLVGLGQTFHLSETSVQGHGRVSGVLGHVEVRSPT